MNHVCFTTIVHNIVVLQFNKELKPQLLTCKVDPRIFMLPYRLYIKIQKGLRD